jgi:WhiB family redox-sensing transcriptional regulator
MTLVGSAGRDAWTRQALCAGHPDRGAWFPENPQDAKRAKAVCRACPVAAECLAFALKTGQNEGIWGGTTPYERRRLRRAGLSAAPPAVSVALTPSR